MLNFIPLPYKIIGVMAVVGLAGGYIWWQDSRIHYLTGLNEKLVGENRVQEAALKTALRESERVQLEIQEAMARVEAANLRLDSTFEELERTRVKFGKHDFASLLSSKPGLITNLMKKATDKTFKDIEEAGKAP